MSRARRNPHESIRSAKQRTAERLIRTLAVGCDSPAKLLELYYWSKEPGMLEVIRAIATMREEVRGAIEAFIALAGDVKLASADLDGRGVLTLASAEAAKTVALARYAAAEDTDDLPRLLH